MLNEAVVRGRLRGIRNVLVQLGMLDGAIEPQREFLDRPGRASRRCRRSAPNEAAFIRFEVECGTFLPPAP